MGISDNEKQIKELQKEVQGLTKRNKELKSKLELLSKQDEGERIKLNNSLGSLWEEFDKIQEIVQTLKSWHTWDADNGLRKGTTQVGINHESVSGTHQRGYKK